MNVLIVYDSTYGNTKKLAKVINDSIGAGAKVLRAPDVKGSDLESVDLLFIGSPTLGGRPTPAIQTLIVNFSERIKGLDIAVFDTRLQAKWVGVFGYAATRIGNSLKQAGGHLVAPPAGFFVTGKTGPLKAGETERAAGWARSVMENRAAR